MTILSNPAEFVSSVKRPADIDAFWEDVMAQTARIPLQLDVTHDPLRSSPQVDVYQVHYTSLDHVRIAGWYARPANHAGQLPGLLVVPGYSMEPLIPKNWAARGYAAFSVAPRGKLRSNGQFNPGYPGLLTHGIVDRNTYTYRGFYMDSCRGVDFLLSRDEVDADRLGVTGHSQGGGLSVVVAALRPEIKVATSGAPFLCGFMDAIDLTDGYPYQEIADYLRLHPDSRQQVTDTVAYFDGISLAPRITCPIIVNIGLQDSTCPPETGYALFRAIGSEDKQLYDYDGYGHDANNAVHTGIIEAFLAQHLEP
ncbi:MAG: acetylxylan esterase [Chloroflexota bacterium]|nr:acetylxylan esterase [Chloroflexota bacterium]